MYLGLPPDERTRGFTRRDAMLLQLTGVVVGLILGALTFVKIRTGWSFSDAFLSWFGLGP